MTDEEWAARLRAYDAQRAEFVRMQDTFFAGIQAARETLDRIRHVWRPARETRATERAHFRARRYLRLVP